MNKASGLLLCAFLLTLLLSRPFAAAETRPIGKSIEPHFDPIDKAVLEFMDRIGCEAATVAISRDGRLLYSHGYGWCDEAKTRPVPADALMRIASVTKPITAAAVKNLINAGKLSLDARAFEIIRVRVPKGMVADPRIHSITVGHLLEHRGGWDRNLSFDPMFRTRQIRWMLLLDGPAEPEDVIAYMLTQPLQFTPGEKTVYSNFGYCVLGRVLEAVMEKPYFDCIQQSVCEPLGIEDIRLGFSALEERDPREVSYPVDPDEFSIEAMDAHGGLIASAPALCRFLDAYWISGDPRLEGQHGNWTFFGSLPGTTAMVRQRQDGINVAVLFNGRRDKHFNEDNAILKGAIDQAIDEAGM